MLYFKAKQCACKTRACNALENQVKTLIEENFQDKNIVFKHVWLNDKDNADFGIIKGKTPLRDEKINEIIEHIKEKKTIRI